MKKQSERLRLIKKFTRLVEKKKNDPPKTFSETLSFACKCLILAHKISKLTEVKTTSRPTFPIGGIIHSGEEIIIPKQSYEKTN